MLLSIFTHSILVAVAVMIHYEVLYRLYNLMPLLKIKHRYRLVIGVLGALIAHISEIFVFALGYFSIIRFTSKGDLIAFDNGESLSTMFDCLYYSFVTYTTLGFGDIVPHGSLRFLTGLEALVGLVLITWTASFLYIEMQKYWDDH